MSAVGFTGTQRGMSAPQRDALRNYLQAEIATFHHGDCIGADSQAHDIASRIGCRIVGHPPSNPSKRAGRICHELRSEKPYLDRNKDIVLETTALIAAPGEMEEQLRSGTWSTVRFAKKCGKPVIIIFPDGTVRRTAELPKSKIGAI